MNPQSAAGLELNRAIAAVLKKDIILTALVGVDQNGRPRIFEATERTQIEPPYVVYSRSPGLPPAGTFARPHSIIQTAFVVSCWEREVKWAWRMFDAVQQALDDKEEWNIHLNPFQLMTVRSLGDERVVPDEGTTWVQIPCTYGVSVTFGA